MGRESSAIASKFRFLKGTAFHPQWFAHRDEARLFGQIGEIARGTVLDVGCSDQRVRHYLSDRVQYLGFDYLQTASEWYGTRPAVYGDAHALPFAGASVDTVLLLDVLEHLRSPEQCLHEINRVLRPGGTLIIKVPFMYPIHDAPLDFQRWTRFGLAQLGEKCGFHAQQTAQSGHPVQTAALVANIAWSKTILNWFKARNPLAILGLLLPVCVFAANVLGFIASALSPADDMMPHGYFWIFRKPA